MYGEIPLIFNYLMFFFLWGESEGSRRVLDSLQDADGTQ